MGETQNGRTNKSLKLGTGLGREKNLSYKTEIQSNSYTNWQSESHYECDPKYLREFKKKDKRDTVELDFIQLGKRFDVVGDKGEREGKVTKSLSTRTRQTEKSGVDTVQEGT